MHETITRTFILQGLSILGLILIIARLMEASREIEFLKVVEIDWLGQFEDLSQGGRSVLKHDIHIFIGKRFFPKFFHCHEEEQEEENEKQDDEEEKENKKERKKKKKRRNCHVKRWETLGYEKQTSQDK